MPDKPRTTLLILICLMSLAGCTYVTTAVHEPDRNDLDKIARAKGMQWQVSSQPDYSGTMYCAEVWRGKTREDFEVECSYKEAEAISGLIEKIPYINAKETVIDSGGE